MTRIFIRIYKRISINGIMDGLNRLYGKNVIGKTLSVLYETPARYLANEIAAFVPLKARILDLGCGHGALAYVLAKKLNASVFGIDVRDVRRYDIEFSLFDGENLPAGEKSFDATIVAFVLHHAANFRKLLQEIRRVTQGVIIIYEDTPANALERKFCTTHGKTFNEKFGIKNSATFLSQEEWREEFTKAGLRLIDTKSVNFPNPFYITHRRMFVLKAD